MQQPEGLSDIRGTPWGWEEGGNELTGEGEDEKALSEWAVLRSTKQKVPETVTPGSCPHFGWDKDSEGEPPHCLELDRSTESVPCIFIFLEEMWNSALGPKGLGHIDLSGLCVCSSQTWLLLSARSLSPPSLLCLPLCTRSTLLWLRRVTPAVLPGLPCRPGGRARWWWIPSPGKAATAGRPMKGKLCTKRKKACVNSPSSLPVWEMRKEGRE